MAGERRPYTKYEVWVGRNMAGGLHTEEEKARAVQDSINAMYPRAAEIVAYTDDPDDEGTLLDEEDG